MSRTSRLNLLNRLADGTEDDSPVARLIEGLADIDISNRPYEYPINVTGTNPNLGNTQFTGAYNEGIYISDPLTETLTVDGGLSTNKELKITGNKVMTVTVGISGETINGAAVFMLAPYAQIGRAHV